jgi:archaellin
MVKGLGGDRCAEVGVGASIIFIALILVSGAAGSVILDSTRSSSNQAVQTFEATLEDLSAGLEVKGIVGIADGDLVSICHLDIMIGPMPGSRPLNLSEVCVGILAPSSYDVRTIGEDGIAYEKLVGDGEVDFSTISEGDLVLLHVDLSSPVHGGETVTISLIPSKGLSSTCTVKVPEAISSRFILLR